MKWDKNIGLFTWDPKYVLLMSATNQPQKHFCAAVIIWTLLTWNVTQQYTEGIAAFALQQCSRERATVVRSAHVAYLVAIWNISVAAGLVILDLQ